MKKRDEYYPGITSLEAEEKAREIVEVLKRWDKRYTWADIATIGERIKLIAQAEAILSEPIHN